MSLSLALSKKTTKKSAQPSARSELLSNAQKKPTTKVMISKALTDLKTRRGVSLHAIKKYMEENYQVNIEKYNYLIKKTLKSGVEKGSIIQIKGIGASGSFKLATVKPEKKRKPVEKADKKENSDAVEKPTKKKKATEEKIKEPLKKEVEKAKKKVEPKMQKPTKSKTVPGEQRDVKTKMAKPKEAKWKMAKGATSKDTSSPGHSGSFNLAVVKPGKIRKPVEKADKKENSDVVEMPAKKKTATVENIQKPLKKEDEKATKKVEQKIEKPTNSKAKDDKTKMAKPKMAKSKMAKEFTLKDMSTPKRRLRASMKKKLSMGSIIKPPKMKPAIA